MTDKAEMIPVFFPADTGMTEIAEIAQRKNCLMILSRSGAIVLQPRETTTAKAIVLPFQVFQSAEPEVA